MKWYVKKTVLVLHLILSLNINSRILLYKAFPQSVSPTLFPAFLFYSFNALAISHLWPFPPCCLKAQQQALPSAFGSLSLMINWQMPVYPQSLRLFGVFDTDLGVSFSALQPSLCVSHWSMYPVVSKLLVCFLKQGW